MTIIERHQLKNFQILEEEVGYFQSKIEMHLGRMMHSPGNIASRMQITLEIISMAIVLKREKDEIIELMNLALSIGMANYHSALDKGSEYTISYNNKSFPIGFKKRSHHVGALTWSKVYSLAVILRDHEAIKFLLSISEDFLKTDNIKLDSVDYSRVNFLKGIYNDSVDIGDLLLEVYNNADTTKIDSGRSKYIHDELLPEMSVYRCVFSNLQDELSEKLTEALELHKLKWSTEKNTMDTRGWVSLPLLAAAIVAKRGKGMSIDVESDYIPKWLIDGDF